MGIVFVIVFDLPIGLKESNPDEIKFVFTTSVLLIIDRQVRFKSYTCEETSPKFLDN